MCIVSRFLPTRESHYSPWCYQPIKGQKFAGGEESTHLKLLAWSLSSKHSQFLISSNIVVCFPNIGLVHNFQMNWDALLNYELPPSLEILHYKTTENIRWKRREEGGTQRTHHWRQLTWWWSCHHVMQIKVCSKWVLSITESHDLIDPKRLDLYTYFFQY